MPQHIEDLRVRNAAFTRFKAVAVDREVRMIELNRDELCLKLSESRRHTIVVAPLASDALPEDLG